ncbi:MAG: LrgB family protein [Proteobacteria bacterium]|nr:LrgB family protein [Pseudomonadota bacterium]
MIPLILISSPLIPLTLTLIAYQIGDYLYRRANFHPLVNPVISAILLLILILHFIKLDYATYFNGAQFINFLLGPATVALAIPLYRAYEHIKSASFPIVCSLIAGSILAIVSVVVIAWLFGGSKIVLLSLAPKSATTPIAMSVSHHIGGLASLTAIFVIIAGIFGALISTPIFNLLKVNDPRARGFATGLVAHAIGTAHKFRINELSGAFAGLAMGINGIATAIIVPILIPIILNWFF